ncbi:WSC domain-containing protein [Sordaria brevicollis]|uniref:WSC domain-containing protein n=1 Tax=Sordaria brevicollis TaxID=83679 RepID=A0AAE0PKK7_SORBR|nr:WSC domain-containing protein [Sordaria brevicollis]
MAPQRALLQGAFLLPFLVSSISAFPSFPYSTDSKANSKAVDASLNQLKPGFSSLLNKRQNGTFTAAGLENVGINNDDDDDIQNIQGAIGSNPGTRLGCYRDNSASSRLLPTSFTASDTLTLEACAVFCSSSPYFGVEYGRECWCASATSGFSPSSPSTINALVDDDECDFECAGNEDQTCGASERIEVYSNALYRPPQVARVQGFDYLGCYRESSPRLLPNALLGDDTLTASKCATYCTSQNYPYFGLEYGRECWCGLAPPFTSQEVSETECSMTCAGAPGEICGAGNRINVYGMEQVMPADVGDYSYLGCYTDSPVTGEKSLTGKVTYDATMTLDKCRRSCEEDGYPYFGTEYGSQCFCGTSLYSETDDNDTPSDIEDDIPARAYVVNDRECSMRCVGDATNSTTCGAANRLSVYWNGEDSTARNLDDEDFDLFDPQLPGSWDYFGCIRDAAPTRALSGLNFASPTMTVELCTRYCSDRNFRLAGLEYQSECYCGTAQDLQTFDFVDSSQCEELCSGSDQEFCGGPRRMTVYGVTQP